MSTNAGQKSTHSLETWGFTQSDRGEHPFKSTATRASTAAGPFGEFYAALLATGMRPTMARLTVARKIAAIALTIWKRGERFDPEQLKRQAA
jgi:hypothetical protein